MPARITLAALAALAGANVSAAAAVPGRCEVPRSHYETFLQKGLFYERHDGEIYYQVYGDRSTRWSIHEYQRPCFARYGIELHPSSE